jgi:hypothetical protein
LNVLEYKAICRAAERLCKTSSDHDELAMEGFIRSLQRVAPCLRFTGELHPPGHRWAGSFGSPSQLRQAATLQEPSRGFGMTQTDARGGPGRRWHPANKLSPAREHIAFTHRKQVPFSEEKRPTVLPLRPKPSSPKALLSTCWSSSSASYKVVMLRNASVVKDVIVYTAYG